MNGLYDFAMSKETHDTVLATMVITSFLAAVRKFAPEQIQATRRAAAKALMVLWNFFVDWMVGFWSLKQGQPIHPGTTKLETHTDATGRDVLLEIPPPPQPAGPAQQTK